MNIGTGQETSVSKLYEIVAKACGSDLAPRPAPARAGEVQRSALDPRRAGLHLGWKPWTGLASGVASVVDHVRRAAL
jgi:UDP-glucose 4-epimerase